jgi:hypothetical protein
MPTANMPTRQHESDGSAFVSALPFQSPLLRLQHHYPAIYGHLTYEDPYVNYVTVTLIAPVEGITTWSGTHEECSVSWEGFLPSGAG